MPPPLEVQTFPACERHADSYSLNPEGDPLPHQKLTIRNHPAASFDDGHRLEVYTDEATIVIFGRVPDQVMRAATALKPAVPARGAAVLTCTAP